MKSRTLSKSEVKSLNQELFQEYGIEPFGKKDLVLELQDFVTYLRAEGEPAFFYEGDDLIPHLKSLLKNNFLKTITVDMGAVKFVASGADVMRPGVVAIDADIAQGEVITIIDENNKKPLAVGRALLPASEMETADAGKVIASMHYVGDKIWELT